MKLYHIHRHNKYDDKFYEGNVIISGEMINCMRERYLSRRVRYLDLLKYKHKTDGAIYDGFNEPLSFEDVIELSELQKMELFIRTYGRDYESMVDLRELMLEEVRTLYHPELPSRFKCMWLTDEKSLGFWENILDRGDVQIYEVDTDGKLFASSNRLLPWMNGSRREMYLQAHHYWTPTDKELYNADDKEILFEGKAKILRRVK